VIDRDPPQIQGSIKKSTPQAHHSHVLLYEGKRLLDYFFPNLSQELIEKGSVVTNMGSDMEWFNGYCFRQPFKSSLTIIQQTRPFLEWHLQERLTIVPNIKVLYQHQVEDIFVDKNTNYVTGVQLSHVETQEQRTIQADLVVDASGSQPFSLKWLRRNSLPLPKQSTIPIQLTYLTQQYRDKISLDKPKKLIYISPIKPPHFKTAGIAAVEGDKYSASIAYYCENHDVKTTEDFIKLSQSLPYPNFYEALKEKEAISEVKTYKIPKSIRNHFENLTDFPRNLVVVGDGSCRFDPLLGLGMTASGKAAFLLEEALKQRPLSKGSFSLSFHKDMRDLVKILWLFERTLKANYPQIVPKKRWVMTLRLKYVEFLFRCMDSSPFITENVVKMINLHYPPYVLLLPHVVMAAIWHNFLRLFKPTINND
jgi:2-polyprenyl-6-methoxyphenol hydroxylase-like FAD-dependent oxidoreductase